jgi:hypothetical protein
MMLAAPERALVMLRHRPRTRLTEGAARLDIVDVNPRVFALADQFPSNGGVVHDPASDRDGRARVAPPHERPTTW